MSSWGFLKGIESYPQFDVFLEVWLFCGFFVAFFERLCGILLVSKH